MMITPTRTPHLDDWSIPLTFKRIRILGTICALLALSVALSGCRIYRIYKTPNDLSQLPGDGRVYYEEGAQGKALIVSSILDDAMTNIEGNQYRPFSVPVRIYVFSQQETFEKYAVHSKAGAETQGARRMLVSPKETNTDKRLPGLVTHELSHYHLYGYTGLHRGIVLPTWFVEGLAVWASGGGGAEMVSEKEATVEILRGNHINPVERRPSFFGRKSKPEEMKEHMFYRQSGLFVGYLHDTYPESFEKMLFGVEDGKNFGTLFQAVYMRSPAEVWDEYVKTLQHSEGP
jgi:hypothetical protein